MKTNISLIGMPACGKSTVGVLLAKAKKMMFTDTDLLIQQKHKSHLWEILESRGIEDFISIEEELICSLECENCCIATGGSAVYSQRAMEHLKKISTIVFLDLPLAEIERRIADIRGRGVVIEKGQTLAELYEQRRPLYLSYADKIINTSELSIEETVSRLMKI